MVKIRSLATPVSAVILKWTKTKIIADILAIFARFLDGVRLMKIYPEYEKFSLSGVAEKVLKEWKENDTFSKTVTSKPANKPFVFFEGPPSANGLPGIHHVMGRTIKDIFCRYKTLQGYRVNRKAGWDTHGLPVELGVEKELGITKEDIGKKLTIAEYNDACRKAVMKYTDIWNNLTEKMGYWVDMNEPYVTYENKYIETVWYLLKNLHTKNLLYKGYTIQPYSPAAGTGLSSHELNQPGCYKDVKDTSAIAQFKVIQDASSEQLFNNVHGDVFFIAWTTTPWTLPSNCALAVGKKIVYQKVKTFNQYTHEPITVVLAKDLVGKYFSPKNADLELSSYTKGDKKIPFELGEEFTGEQLEGIHYEQLMPYVQPEEGDAFRVILGDFVTTEDGTGIVHTASVFGADDFRVCQLNNVPSILVKDEEGNPQPLVDKKGRFVKEVTDFAGQPVKEEYLKEEEKTEGYLNVDIQISIKLKEENRAFKVEKYEHSYPHCWRTDKPVLYYPLDSWFVRTTEAKDDLIRLNNTINWKPKSTGTGRFGNWLENLQDWNLSRSRYWGIPLPIWRSEDGKQEKVIGSIEELKAELDKSVAAGLYSENPIKDFVPNDFSKDNYDKLDLHRPFVDDYVLVGEDGEKLTRETDLIDVWFDSGSMPYAQWHYPFENKEIFEQAFPADFIAEGVDQTRGWFFTLHAIATMNFDSVAYKNVVSNGLVLDKNGQKMSKRLGNAIDPFTTLSQYGPDATRWYMISNAQPWDNLKFDLEGITEVQRKFFRALQNTYSFFALYANIDGFTNQEPQVEFKDRPEMDRWVLSKLNSLVKAVEEGYENYEPTKAAREIQDFVVENLSNWYVRLGRRRFWKGEISPDKMSAYQTLHECLRTVAVLSAPIAPFYTDELFKNLESQNANAPESVHLADFPKADESKIDVALEERMTMAQNISSMILSLRKKEKIKVRQPLHKAMVPVLNQDVAGNLNLVADLIKSEVNIKELDPITDPDVFVKSIKPNFKTLGPRFGKSMKQVAGVIAGFGQEEIQILEREGALPVDVNGEQQTIELGDVEIMTADIPGFLVTSENGLTVALDVQLNQELIDEGVARELVNRIQNLRKDSGLDVTDKIKLEVISEEEVKRSIQNNLDYICSETLTEELQFVQETKAQNTVELEVEEGVSTFVGLIKLN